MEALNKYNNNSMHANLKIHANSIVVGQREAGRWLSADSESKQIYIYIYIYNNNNNTNNNNTSNNNNIYLIMLC